MDNRNTKKISKSKPNTSGSTLVYRTGPFAPNPNYGRYFNDGNIARKYSPSEFRDLTQSIAFEDGEMCSGIDVMWEIKEMVMRCAITDRYRCIREGGGGAARRTQKDRRLTD